MKRFLIFIIIILLSALSFVGFNQKKSKKELYDLKSEMKILKNKEKNKSLVKINNETDVTVEEFIYILLNKENKTKKDIETIYLLLPEANYDEIIYFEKALEWASENIDIDHEKNMINFIKLSDNLNCGCSEGYGRDIYNIYKQNNIKFLKYLAEVPNYAENIYGHIAFELHYKDEWIKEKEKLIKLLEHKDLDSREKNIIEKFIEVLDGYIDKGI
ncbi:hypothetical protein IZY60_07670 [Lutibacter sp. B2]|nr:hypothetical protein [Lutibacter sp. B2]